MVSRRLGDREAHRPGAGVRGTGALARTHRKAYGGIDDVDYLIAATALLLEAELLTTNVRHFTMLPDLRAAY